MHAGHSFARGAWARMGRSRTAWALSVALPWCMGLAVLVSITAEADEEPPAGESRFLPTGMIEAAARLARALQAARPLRGVNEDGEPLPIAQARLAVGDP